MVQYSTIPFPFHLTLDILHDDQFLNLPMAEDGEENLFLPEYHFTPGESPSQAEAVRGHHPTGLYSSQTNSSQLLSPTFTGTSPGVVTSSGSPTTLQCFIKADPPPTVQWFHNGVECVDAKKFCALKESSTWCLLVEDTGSDDGGDYRVLASNLHGSQEFMFHVTVLKPLPPSKFKVSGVGTKMRLRGQRSIFDPML